MLEISRVSLRLRCQTRLLGLDSNGRVLVLSALIDCVLLVEFTSDVLFIGALAGLAF